MNNARQTDSSTPSRADAEPREERVRHVREALASVRLEGLEPSLSVLALFKEYEDGRLSAEVLGEAIRSLPPDGLH